MVLMEPLYSEALNMDTVAEEYVGVEKVSADARMAVHRNGMSLRTGDMIFEFSTTEMLKKNTIRCTNKRYYVLITSTVLNIPHAQRQ